MIIESFKSKLQTRDIYVKQSNNVDVSLLENAGFWFPLIRLGDKVLSKADIVSFEYSVGSSLLPTCNLTINDNNYRFRELDLTSNTLYATIYISNNFDKTYAQIKQEHVCISIDSSSSSEYVSITTMLYVPALHAYVSESFEGTSIELCKSLARSCELGFASNVTASQDSQIWLICKNRYASLTSMTKSFMTTMDDIVKVYVDQYSRLCYISMKASLTDTVDHDLLTHPTTGDALTGEKIVLSNKKMIDNRAFIPIDSYTITQNLGQIQLSNVQASTYSLLSNNLIEFEKSDTSISVENSVKSINERVKMFRQDSNLHSNYQIKQDSANIVAMQMSSRSKMQATVSHYIPALLCSMRVPIDFEFFDRAYDGTTQSNASIDVDSTIDLPKYTVLGYRSNDLLSKNWVISSMSFSYRDGASIKTNLQMIES